MYQIAKKLSGADKILRVLGYEPLDCQDSQELAIRNEVDVEQVVKTAADLVILQCDLELLRGNAKEIAREYPQLNVLVADIIHARRIEGQTYTDTYNDALTAVMERSGYPVRREQVPSLQPSLVPRGVQEPVHSGAGGYFPVGASHSGYQEEYRTVPTTLYVSKNMGPSSLRVPSENSFAGSDNISRRGSAPQLGGKQQRDLSGEYNINTYDRSVNHQGSTVPQNISQKSDAGSRSPPRLVSLPEQQSSEEQSTHFSVGSPTSEESNSLISFSPNMPRPDPNELPEPVFSNEEAITANIPNQPPHFRRESSESSYSESRVGIFVNPRSTDHGGGLPSMPGFSPLGNLHYNNGTELAQNGSELDQNGPKFGLSDVSKENIPLVVADAAEFDKAPVGCGDVTVYSEPNPIQPINTPLNHKPAHISPDSNPPTRPYLEHTKPPSLQTTVASLTANPPVVVPFQATVVTSQVLEPSSCLEPSQTRKAMTVPLISQDKTLNQDRTSQRRDHSLQEKGIVDGFVMVTVQHQLNPSEDKKQTKSEETRSRLETKGDTSDHSLSGTESKQDVSCSESNLDNKNSRRFLASQTWTCDYCTFLNAISITTCEVCGIPKKNSN